MQVELDLDSSPETKKGLGNSAGKSFNEKLQI